MITRKRILFEAEEDGPEYVATFQLKESDIDDDFNSSDVREVIMNAPDFESAVKFAQQYLRKMQIEEETAAEWEDAEILSVQLR